jgi:diguanylate cyclase (GGDEF)-like protein
MPEPVVFLKSSILRNCLVWVAPELNGRLISPLETTFPNFALPSEVRDVKVRLESIQKSIEPRMTGENIDLRSLVEEEWNQRANVIALFKQILLLYRRSRAARLEILSAKTIHPGMAATIAQEIVELDVVATHEWFQRIPKERLPRLKDFLPLQLVEEYFENSESFRLPPRAFDEKFRILFAPALDLAYFRAKGEARDTSVAVAFLDIDNFKSFNEEYSETTIDRNLLPRLMQTIEAHVHNHGYAYRQGGDEYLILVPNLSNSLTIAFLDDLRRKIANLKYPGIDEQTNVSIGFCIADPDSSLTDRELLECANQAKKFAKKSRNCLATYSGPHLRTEELHVVSEPDSSQR